VLLDIRPAARGRPDRTGAKGREEEGGRMNWENTRRGGPLLTESKDKKPRGSTSFVSPAPNEKWK